MDLNRLISRIENYLGKDLKFSMREFRQLQSLRDDVLKLEEIMGYSGKNQAALLGHYKGHAQELQRYSERIEKRLYVWIKRLEGLITAEEQQNLTARDKRYFELFKNKIDVCKNNLVRILARGGELHNLINDPSPDWKKIEAKINEALGDNLHPGIRTLVALFEQLEQAEEKLGKYSLQEITPEEYQKRLGQLKEIGFPVEKEPQLADFLIKHWDGTIEMLQAAGPDAGYLFGHGLPAVKDIINERTWPGMVEMAKAAGPDAGYLFGHGLPAVKHIINERNFPMIVNSIIEMIKAAGPHAGYLFEHGLPAVKYIINERTWPGMVEMAKAAGPDAWHLFLYGLPAVERIINERTWPVFVINILSVGQYRGHIQHLLHFIPQSLFKSIPVYKSIGDFNKLLERQISLAKQYFDEVGFTVYSKKVIDENFWNFSFDDRIFNRLKFGKTGSGLVPLGGRFKTKYLVRIISQESYEAWKTAHEANIPVEEIVRAYPAKNGRVRVFCKYGGQQLSMFILEHPELEKEVIKQRDAIIESLKELAIVHGHLHDGNFTVSEENEKLVVRAIDFDQAVSPPI